MNRVLRSSTISGSLKVDARSMMPLFQTQASGLPAMAQRKIGFCSVAASRCASKSDSLHGIVRQTSSFDGRTSLCSLLNSSSVRLPPVGSLAFSVRFAMSKPITANVSNTVGKTFCEDINMAVDAPFVMKSPRSCGPVPYEKLFHIRKSKFSCPSQWCSPRFVVRQVGRSTALQQEFDHPPPSLGLLWPIFFFTSPPAANRRGQRRFVELEASGVDVGAGVQKHCRDGPVSVLAPGVQKGLAEPVRSVWLLDLYLDSDPTVLNHMNCWSGVIYSGPTR